ncbi:hypothetical protein KXJ69_10395 [Aureisphaera sp. CAU 1614]|uniref:Uncharacterized protein n=1 Tax=Halomarinibacterium sedimenti TaxID=2857106 RepID=A0A9X1FR08_9FLAO|nr:hypothetical protein [Halomarinibacterium sedimenti]MBW2938519.1 hypothetical protein [Halomarinibacterium sedimenti]
MAHRNSKEFGKDMIQVFSSGIETNLLNTGAVSIMTKVGIDISNYSSL